MENLLKPDDVAAILQVSRRTAYKIMKEMPHMTTPFRVTEYVLRDWISSKTSGPGKKKWRSSACGPHIPRRKEMRT